MSYYVSTNLPALSLVYNIPKNPKPHHRDQRLKQTPLSNSKFIERRSKEDRQTDRMKNIPLLLMGCGGVGRQLLQHIVSCRSLHAQQVPSFFIPIILFHFKLNTTFLKWVSVRQWKRAFKIDFEHFLV